MSRRLMLRNPSSGDNLPSELQRCEYILNTGGSYIKTNIGYRLGLTVKTKQQFYAMSDSYMFSAARSVSGSQISYAGTFGNSSWLQYACGQYFSVEENTNQVTETEATFLNGDQKIYVNGVLAKNATYSISNYAPDENIKFYIFCRNNANGSPSMFCKSKLFYLQVLDGTTLIADFIPCYRKSGGEIGMYDTVSQAFFTNAGEGSFVKGADV